MGKKIVKNCAEFSIYIKNEFLQTLEEIEIQEESVQPHQNKLFFVSIKDECVYIDGTQIILKKAKLQFAIFKILMKAHALGCLHSDSRNLTIHKIMEKLEKMGIYILDAEKQIRESIHYIRKNINTKLGPDLGNIILESTKNGGYQILHHPRRCVML